MSEGKEFDGVISADNKMPGWYVWSFVATVIIAVSYYTYYHGIADFNAQDKLEPARAYQEYSYLEQVAEHKKVYGSDDMPTTGGNPLRGDATAIAAGKATFTSICAACHKADATGLIGPNLTDNEWLHSAKGNSITEDEVFDIVFHGRTEPLQNPPKGPMPAHEGSIGAKGVWQVVAYLQDTYKNIENSGN